MTKALSRTLSAKLDTYKAGQLPKVNTFGFVSKYEPKIAEINIEGNVILLLDTKKGEEVLNSWKKDKKIPKEVMGSILNTALTKSNIQALILSQEMGLPAPIPLPKVKIGEK